MPAYDIAAGTRSPVIRDVNAIRSQQRGQAALSNAQGQTLQQNADYYAQNNTSAAEISAGEEQQKIAAQQEQNRLAGLNVKMRLEEFLLSQDAQISEQDQQDIDNTFNAHTIGTQVYRATGSAEQAATVVENLIPEGVRDQLPPEMLTFSPDFSKGMADQSELEDPNAMISYVDSQGRTGQIRANDEEGADRLFDPANGYTITGTPTAVVDDPDALGRGGAVTERMLADLEVAYRGLNSLAGDIKNALPTGADASAVKLGITGAAFRGIDAVASQIEGITKFMTGTDGEPVAAAYEEGFYDSQGAWQVIDISDAQVVGNDIQASILNGREGVAMRDTLNSYVANLESAIPGLSFTAAESAGVKRDLLTLAVMEARLYESDGRLSDFDVKIRLDAMNVGSIPQLHAVLDRIMIQASRKRNDTMDVYRDLGHDIPASWGGSRTNPNPSAPQPTVPRERNGAPVISSTIENGVTITVTGN